VSSCFAELAGLLPEGAVRTDAEALATYGRDWVRLRQPNPVAVAFPDTTAQTLGIVRWARRNRMAIVPSGGRTGLSGGALADNGQLVVSCERMDKILGTSRENALITAQSGVTIKRIQDAAKSVGLYYPIDFAPAATMHVGGTIATNAGGVHVVRYGMTRQWVAGLEVVVAMGGQGAEVLDLSLSVPKNNTGYDLKQLFIGSEGTLGIITSATLRLAIPPASPSLALVCVDDTERLVAVGTQARNHGTVTAVEFWDDAGMRLATAHLGIRAPVPPARWYVLAELDGPPAASAAWIAACQSAGLARNGILRPATGEVSDVWAIRLAIGTAVAPFTPYKNDVSVPISALPAFLRELQTALPSRPNPGEMVVWGHLLDGNLHVNCLKPPGTSPADFALACQHLDHGLYSLVAAHRGSISAEHGVGLLKKHALHFSRTPGEIEAMRQIKGVFDPDNIMNPGKIFDQAPPT